MLSRSVMSDSLQPTGLFVAHQAPLSVGFSRQEYWSGCHFLLQGIFPTQGSNLLHWQGHSFPLHHWGSPSSYVMLHYKSRWKVSSLKQQTFITFQFLWVRNLGTPWPGPLIQGLSLGCSQGLGWGHSRLEARVEDNTLPISFMWLLAGFSSMCWAGGLSSSLAVGWRPFSVSCPMNLSIGWITTWQLALSEQASQKTQKVSKAEVTIFLL